MEDVVWQVAHAGEEEGQDDGVVAWDPASSLLAVGDGRRLVLLDAHAPHERAELRMPRGDNDDLIAALEWSPVGTPRTLLVATRGGLVAVWSQRRRGGVLGARGGGGQPAPMPPHQPPAPLLGNGGPPLLPRDSSLGPPPSPPLAALLNAAAPSPPAAAAGGGVVKAAAAAVPSPPTHQQQQPPPLLARATPPSERAPPPPIVAAQPTLALDGSAWTCTVVVTPGEEDGGGERPERRRLLVHASWLVPQSRHAPLDAAAFRRLAQEQTQGAPLTRDQVFCRAAATDDGANKAAPPLPPPLPWVREGTLALALLEEEQDLQTNAGQPAPALAHLTLRVCKAQQAPGRTPAWRCSPRAVVCERPLVASKAGARSSSSGPVAAHQGRRPNAHFVAAARYWDGGGGGAPAVAATSSTAAAGCVLVAVGVRCDEGDAGAAADSSSGAVVALYATPPGDPLALDSAGPTSSSSSSSSSSPWPLGEVSVGGIGGGLLALAWDPHAAASSSYDARLAFLMCEPSSGGVRAGVLLVSSLRGLPRGVRMQPPPPAAANDAALIIPLPPASGALGVPSFGLAWSPAVRAQLVVAVSLAGLALAVFDVAGEDGALSAARMGGAAKGRGARPPPPLVQVAFSPNAACLATCSRGKVTVWPTPAAVRLGGVGVEEVEGGGGGGSSSSSCSAELAAALAWPVVVGGRGGGGGTLWDVAQLAAFVAKKAGTASPVWRALDAVGGLLMTTTTTGQQQRQRSSPSSPGLALDRLKLAVAEAVMLALAGTTASAPSQEVATAVRVAAEARLRLMLGAAAQPLLAALEPREREAKAHARAVVASGAAAVAPKIEAAWLGLDDPLDAAAVRAWAARLRGLLLLVLACAKAALGRARRAGQAAVASPDDVPFVRLLPDLELARTVQRLAQALAVGAEAIEAIEEGGGGGGDIAAARDTGAVAAAAAGAAADPLAALETAAAGLGDPHLGLAAVAAAFATVVEDVNPGFVFGGGEEDEAAEEEDGDASAPTVVAPLPGAAQQHYARASQACRLAGSFKASEADATAKRLRTAVGAALWDRLPHDLDVGQIGVALARLLGVVVAGGGGGAGASSSFGREPSSFGAASAGYGRELALRAGFRAAAAMDEGEEGPDAEEEEEEEAGSSFAATRRRRQQRLWRRAVVARALGQPDAVAVAAQCSVDAVSGGALMLVSAGGGANGGVGGAPPVPMLISCDGGSATRALNAAVLSSASGGRLSGAQARQWAHASPVSGAMWRRAE
jgi:hypothetical protein